MKRRAQNTIPVVFIIAVFAGIFAALFFSKFEFYRRPAQSPPSGAAERNRYLAVDAWLRKEGHPLRILSSGSVRGLADGAERTALIYSSSFDWEDAEELDALLDSGYALTIFIDDRGNEKARAFLERQALRYRIIDDLSAAEDEDAEEDAGGDDAAEAAGEETADADGAEEEAARFPDFDRAFFAGIDEKRAPAEPERFTDWEGETRLCGWETEKSALFMTGIPSFMSWDTLQGGGDGAIHTENARLSWRISGALDREKKGILIIRGADAAGARGRADMRPGFWERFFEHRLGAPVIAAVFLTAFIGFWMTIPSFGRWKPERVFPGMPIRRRFVTESRFFKKERSLFVYLEPYAGALRARYRAAGIEDDAEIIRRLAADAAIDEERAAHLLFPSTAPVSSGLDLEKYRSLGQRALENSAAGSGQRKP
jgi:hypothetical protein